MVQLGGHESLLEIDGTKESIIVIQAKERHPGENLGRNPVFQHTVRKLRHLVSTCHDNPPRPAAFAPFVKGELLCAPFRALVQLCSWRSEIEVHRHLCQYLDWFSIQQRGAISPLLDSLARSPNQERMTAQHLQIFYPPLPIDDRLQNNGALNPHDDRPCADRTASPDARDWHAAPLHPA